MTVPDGGKENSRSDLLGLEWLPRRTENSWYYLTGQ
jgi:hypothetical protein